MSYPHTLWNTVRISSLYEALFDGPHATPEPSNEGPVFLGIKNLTDDGKLDLSQIPHITEKEFPKWTKRVTPRAGDIVFTYEATLHRYAIIPHGFRGCLGRRLALIRPDESKVDTRFLFYYFFGHEWREMVSGKVNIGATVDRIPLIDFPNFPVRIPGVEAQRRIAAILSAYDDLIENDLLRIKILEEMAQNRYREWFVKFRFPGHEQVRMVDSPLGKIREGWEVVPMEDVCARITDGAHRSPKSVESGFPMASAKDMHDWGINVSTCRTISEEEFRNLERNDCKMRKDDVLVAKDGSYLKHWFLFTPREA